ncbi:FAD-dependent oxidoreductase [Methylopila henanensis]|uniref:FAD-dependent oxidoreductase n=1 Tax=Methylopila henanensis TaxID=873516 RepID=A0ABW4K5Q3_9HYPH
MSAPVDPMASSSDRPFRVAVLGGGPSGFYAAEALLRSDLPVAVDMFERLPTPFGLVRFGVAPDHPKLKQVCAVFDRIARMPGFRFFGGIEIGVDVSLESLRTAYDAVILATGASVDRRLGTPGEDLPGSHTAGEFVGWYNGHPDFSHLSFDLSAERAVIVGHGNVALDVARILLKTVDELRATDIAEHALDALARSRIREVQIVGRRGPAETRFSPKELHEFQDIAECSASLDASDLQPDSFTVAADAGPDVRAAIGLLENFGRESESKSRRCVFRFHLDPVRIEGDGRVERVSFARTLPAGGRVEIDCGLLFASIGRRAAPLVGAPYDEARGTHANVGGRIVSAGSVGPGLYACGWSKRGPQGTIGTNRACSADTVAAVIADLRGRGAPPAVETDDLLARVATGCLDYEAWRRIDAAEIERGRVRGKPREKFVTVADMVSASA